MYRVLCVGAVVASMALALFVIPHAEAAGSVVKGSGPAVYYVGTNGKRYVFPTSSVYFSWYPDFSKMKMAEDKKLNAYPISGHVLMRPGTRLLKSVTDPKVYAVEPGGIVRWVATEAIAQSLYGSSWAKRVDDLPDTFFASYRKGDPLAAGEYPNGFLAIDAGVTPASVVLFWDGQKRAITDKQLTELRLDRATLPSPNLSKVEAGEAIKSGSKILSALTDPTQTGFGRFQSSDVQIEALPTDTTIDFGQRDAELLRFMVSVSEKTSVKSLVVQLRAGRDGDADADVGGLLHSEQGKKTVGNLDHIRLVDARGTKLFPEQTLGTALSGDGTQTLTFTGQYIFEPGRHRVSLVADVDGGVPADEPFQAAISLEKSMFVVGAAQTKRVSPSSLSGPTVVARTGNLVVGLASSSRSTTALHGEDAWTDSVVFSIRNPRAETVMLEELTLTGYIDEGEGNADFQQGSDEDGDGTSTSVASVVPNISIAPANDLNSLKTIPMGGDGKAKFVSLGWMIPAKSTLAVAVRIVPSSGAPFERGADRVSFDIADASTDVYAKTAKKVTVGALGRAPNGGKNPKYGLTVSAGSGLTVRGSEIAPARILLASERVAMYRVQLQAPKEEDVGVTAMAFTLVNAETVRDITNPRLSYSTDGGPNETEGKIDASGRVTFDKLSMFVPMGGSAEATLLVDVLSTERGAVAGDKLGFSFDPLLFSAGGARTDRKFTSATLDASWRNLATAGKGVVLRKNTLSVTGVTGPIARTQTRAAASELFQFRLQSSGDGQSEVQRLTFRIQVSDVGTPGDGNDLLETLAANGARATLLEAGGAQIAESSEYKIYDASARAFVTPERSSAPAANGPSANVVETETPTIDAETSTIEAQAHGFETGVGDFGVIVFNLSPAIRVRASNRTYALRLNTTGLAVGSKTVQVMLLGGEDFVWVDQSGGSPQNGSTAQSVPIAGATVTFR